MEKGKRKRWSENKIREEGLNVIGEGEEVDKEKDRMEMVEA